MNSLLGVSDLSKAKKLWTKSDLGTIKLNIDGAIFDVDGKFGFGCVARNHVGEVIDVMAEARQEIVQPEVVEALGVKEALSWIKAKGWNRVQVESDCLTTIQAINNSISMVSMFGLIIEDCRSFGLNWACGTWFGCNKQANTSKAQHLG